MANSTTQQAGEARPYDEPAFPVQEWGAWQFGGMSLGDVFAAQIVSGMAAHSGTQGAYFGPGDIAARSYEIAHAMLRERTRLSAIPAAQVPA